jgi:hypothetical protein
MQSWILSHASVFLNQSIELDIILITDVQRDRNLTVALHLSLCVLDNIDSEEFSLC